MSHNAGPFNVLALYSKSTKNIVYAEVDSSFMDYWCALFRQPLGSIIKRMYSCNDNDTRESACTSVYESLRTLPQDYFSESKTSILEKTSKSRKDRKVANSGSHGPVFVKDTFKFIVTDHFQFHELGASKSIEIMHAEKVQDMSDLDSKLICIDEAVMLKMLGRVLQNRTSVLNDVLGKFVKKGKKDKKSQQSSLSSSGEKKHKESGLTPPMSNIGTGVVDPQLSEQYSRLGQQYTKLGDQYNQMSEQARAGVPIGEFGESRLGDQYSHLSPSSGVSSGIGSTGVGTGLGTGVGTGVGTGTGLMSHIPGSEHLHMPGSGTTGTHEHMHIPGSEHLHMPGSGTTGTHEHHIPGSGLLPGHHESSSSTKSSPIGSGMSSDVSPSVSPSISSGSGSGVGTHFVPVMDPSLDQSQMQSSSITDPSIPITDPSLLPSSKMSTDPSATSRMSDESSTSKQHPFVI
jgi:hypothetical protein